MSSHLTVEREGLVVKDSAVLQTLSECLQDLAECGADKKRSEVLCVVEINGGVVSLGPFGSLQCDCIGLCCCNLVLKKNCCHIYLFIYGLNFFFFFFLYFLSNHFIFLPFLLGMKG